MQQDALMKYYQRRHPDWCVIARSDSRNDGHLIYLHKDAVFFDHLVLNGRRIVPSYDAYKAPNSIIQSCFRNRGRSAKFVGQVVSIFQHQQQQTGPLKTLVQVRWFKPLRDGIINPIKWDT